ncbi:MAG: molybdenum cofactor biosynthesis protein [Proteobacteria bacterium]|nr:molybdenum cofactor biosynthesis protein [Pseudomonadota bacterium]
MKSRAHHVERHVLPPAASPAFAIVDEDAPPGSTPLPSIDPLLFDAPPRAKSSAPVDALRAAGESTSGLEAMPHILAKIQEMWKSRDLNTFIAQLFLDSRDGGRAGLPVSVARELMFLAHLNQVVRAEEAAPLLGIEAKEAIALVAKGDQLALGNSASDIWSLHLADAERWATSPAGQDTPPQAAMPGTRSGTPLASPKLSGILRDTPPLPPAVRLDITTPKALRSARGGFEEGGIMDKGLFRCLAKELSSLQIDQIVLSSLGNSAQCDWLASGIRFTRMHCKFRKVVLHVDLLSAPEKLLRQCIHEGAGHLVIYLNLASGKWRAQAQELAATDPDYFRREVSRLVRYRDEYEARSGKRCAISIATTSRRSAHAQGHLFSGLDEISGLVKYHEIALPPGISALDAQMRGRCHCLAPFIEAHVRTNGHLVACAQDHSGYSFAADLTKTTFTDAWLSQAYRMTRLRVARGERAGRLCEICPHRQPN